MAADFRLRLRHFGWSRNPEAPMRLVDGRRAGPTPFSEPERVEFSIIETHLLLSWSERISIERLTLSM